MAYLSLAIGEADPFLNKCHLFSIEKHLVYVSFLHWQGHFDHNSNLYFFELLLIFVKLAYGYKVWKDSDYHEKNLTM